MLTQQQISEVKGYLALGHKQHDIAAKYGVNGGRIAEVSKGKVGASIKPAPASALPPLKAQARFFTPSQSPAEQIAILDDLTKNYSEAARPYLITPQLAEYILAELNGGNRKVSNVKVSEYEDAMSVDEWPVTGATIVFGKSGRMLDGQHRLRACIRANKAFRSYIVFGIDDSAFSFIDAGRKRTNPDVFKIAGVANAEATAKAVRWLRIFHEDPVARGLSMTNYEALCWYRDNVTDKELLAHCVANALSIERTIRARFLKIPAGNLAALLYEFSKKSKKDADVFATLMLEKRGQARTLYSLLAEVLEQSGGRIHDVFRNAAIIKAWNYFRANKRVSKDALRYDAERNDYPEIN